MKDKVNIPLLNTLDSLTKQEWEILDLLIHYVRLTGKSLPEAVQLSWYQLQFFKENNRLPRPEEIPHI